MRPAVLVSALVFLVTFMSVQGRPEAAGAQQGALPARPKPTILSGAELYTSACAACHGPDGKGRERSQIGFDVPLPDFSNCSFASREPDADWIAIAHQGGPVRGFSRMMPSFGEALAPEDLVKILGHIRTFCSDPSWPRGELNLPRTFFTEKAYPEDEAVITTSINTSGPGGISNTLLFEKRFGSRNQIEIKLPIEANVDEQTSAWTGGAGDITFGFKRTVAHSLRRGYIFALAAEAVFPTGDEAAGLSKNTPVFESFVSYGQMLPRDMFLQAQVGVELPVDPAKAEREAFWRVAAGKTWVQGKFGFGRAWSPMLELVAARALETGERIHWDLVPQVQVTLNTRQHLMLSAGMRFPLNQRQGRHSQFLVYFLWDWFDGGLRDGW